MKRASSQHPRERTLLALLSRAQRYPCCPFSPSSSLNGTGAAHSRCCPRSTASDAARSRPPPRCSVCFLASVLFQCVWNPNAEANFLLRRFLLKISFSSGACGNPGTVFFLLHFHQGCIIWGKRQRSWFAEALQSDVLHSQASSEARIAAGKSPGCRPRESKARFAQLQESKAGDEEEESLCFQRRRFVCIHGF